MIPKRIIRSVPEHTSEEVETWWRHTVALHPDWTFATYRDPIPPAWFPISGRYFDRCQNGAQLAGLVRLEALWQTGGIWLDSDIQLVRPLDELLDTPGFACREDIAVIPDAVLGASAGHPAIHQCLKEAIRRLRSDDTDWRTGNGAWSTGPGVTTQILDGRDDFVILQPEAFFPVHYREKHLTRSHQPQPATFGIHHWSASWLPLEMR